MDAIFKAYDVRGRVGTELTEETVQQIGKAFADWLPEQGLVAVGRDMRPDSAALAKALIEGLKSQGRDVINIGQVTTDMIYFAVGHYKYAGGAVVTASHNPGADNGIKFCASEARAVGAESGLFEIRDIVKGGSFKPAAANPGKTTDKDIVEDWVEHVLSFIDLPK